VAYEAVIDGIEKHEIRMRGFHMIFLTNRSNIRGIQIYVAYDAVMKGIRISSDFLANQMARNRKLEIRNPIISILLRIPPRRVCSVLIGSRAALQIVFRKISFWGFWKSILGILDIF